MSTLPTYSPNVVDEMSQEAEAIEKTPAEATEEFAHMKSKSLKMVISGEQRMLIHKKIMA